MRITKSVQKLEAYVPGEHFFCDGGHENTLRLNFSNSTVEQIHTGMRTLRAIFEEALCHA